MALGLGGNHRHPHIVLGDRHFDIANVGNPVLAGELIVSLMDPVGLVGIIGDHRQLEARM